MDIKVFKTLILLGHPGAENLGVWNQNLGESVNCLEMPMGQEVIESLSLRQLDRFEEKRLSRVMGL